NDAALTATGDVWHLDVTGTTLADATYSVVASATDVAGNTAADTQAIVIDTTAPVRGPIDITTPTDTGIDDKTTGHGNPVITFTGEPGLTITLKGPDNTDLTPGTHYTVTYGGGTYTITLVDAKPGTPGNQPYGDYSGSATTGNPPSTADGVYTLVATDESGNSATVDQFTIDTIPPATPTVDGQFTVLTQPVITGTYSPADAAGGLVVTIDGRTYTLGTDAALTVSGNKWSLDLSVSGQSLAVKAYEVVVAAKDLAGNGVMDVTNSEITILPVAITQPDPVPPPTQPTPPQPDLTPPQETPRNDGQGRPIEDTRGLLADSRIGDHLTANGDNAFRIAVAKAVEPSLTRFFGVPDQNFENGKRVRFQLPADAFLHTKENAVVRLNAEQVSGADDTKGGPLPSWLNFNATAGIFEGVAPEGAPSEIAIRVTARDEEGREASTIFRLKLTAGEKVSVLNRISLDDQFKKLLGKPMHLDRLAQIERAARQPVAVSHRAV
ncbi:MAG: hypothetical protein RLZZ271_730, partial [Pseudomonadota bacterium]